MVVTKFLVCLEEMGCPWNPAFGHLFHNIEPVIQVGSEVDFDVSNKVDELSNFLSNHNDRILFPSPSVPTKFNYIGGTIRDCDIYIVLSMCRTVICRSLRKVQK